MKLRLPVPFFRFRFPVFGLLLFVLLATNRYPLIAHSAFAQELGIGVATRLTLMDKEAPDGSIVSWSAGGYRLASQPYDPGLFGVVVDNPAVSLEDLSLPQSRPVLTAGRALVRVSPANGAISEGSFITSSNITGVGQRADRNGFVLGTALEDLSGSEGEKKIWVEINIRSTTGSSLKTNLFDFLKLGILAPFEAPLNALRYLLASVFMIISFILGFLFFGRVVAKGVEALGRNPLAKNVIGLSIVFNLILTVVIMLFGLALAYLILKL